MLSRRAPSAHQAWLLYGKDARPICRGPTGKVHRSDGHTMVVSCGPLQEGARWRRRRPRWLLVERTMVAGLWRASQAAFRGGWATTRTTEATLPMVPALYKVPRPFTLALWLCCLVITRVGHPEKKRCCCTGFEKS